MWQLTGDGGGKYKTVQDNGGRRTLAHWADCHSPVLHLFQHSYFLFTVSLYPNTNMYFFRDTGTCFLEAPVGRDCPSLLLPLSSQRFSLLAHSQCHSHFHTLLSFSHLILHCFSCSYSSISQLPKLLTIGSYPQTGRAAVQVLRLLRFCSRLLLSFAFRILVNFVHAYGFTNKGVTFCCCAPNRSYGCASCIHLVLMVKPLQ